MANSVDPQTHQLSVWLLDLKGYYNLFLAEPTIYAPWRKVMYINHNNTEDIIYTNFFAKVNFNFSSTFKFLFSLALLAIFE